MYTYSLVFVDTDVMDSPEPGFIRVEIDMLIKEEEYRAMIDRYVINYLKASYPESISLSALKA